MSEWAAKLDLLPELGDTPLPTWGLLRQVFTVETIMTPRRDLLTAERGTDLAPLRAQARRCRFDLVPLTQGGRIVEILLVEVGTVEPFTGRWPVSRDTDIPALVRLFLETGQPGFFV